MITIPVVSGGEVAMDALLSRNNHPNNEMVLNQMHQQFQTKYANINNSFTQDYNNMFAIYRNDDVTRYSKQLMASVTDLVNDDQIYVIDSNNYTNINIGMMKWMMCNPHIQDMYQDDKISGYEEAYIDIEEGVDSLERGDYLTVMDGVACHSNGYDTEYYSDTRYEELDDIEQMAILDSWYNLDQLMAKGYDATDTSGGLI